MMTKNSNGHDEATAKYLTGGSRLAKWRVL